MADKWIIPCNLKHFDLIKHFSQSDTVVWKNMFTIKEGDEAYIYLSSPISAIVYRCKVISNFVTDEELQNNAYAIPEKESRNYFSKKIKYIKMKLELKYPKELLSLDALRKHGLGQVQIQARADRSLSQYLNEIDQQLITKSENGSDENA